MSKTIQQQMPMPEDESGEAISKSKREMMEYAKVELVPISSLKVDKSYQRPLSEVKVRAIMKNFNLESASTLTVSRRKNGETYIEDGQHRLEAMRRLGYLLALCQIHNRSNTLTEDEAKEVESSTFITSNTVRGQPRAIDLFRARVMSKEPAALTIARIVKECGCEVEHVHNSRGEPIHANKVEAVAELDDILRQGGEDALRKVFYLALRTWPGNSEALRGTVLGGIFIFYRKFGNDPIFREQRFISRLSSISITKLLQDARVRTNIIGLRSTDNFARVLYTEYNKQLHQENRLPDKFGIDGG